MLLNVLKNGKTIKQKIKDGNFNNNDLNEV